MAAGVSCPRERVKQIGSTVVESLRWDNRDTDDTMPDGYDMSKKHEGAI
jgi:hypothetical protein